MPDHDFVFALETADDAASSRMLGDLCSAVLDHVGYAAPAVAEMTAALSAALSQDGTKGARRCDVRFVVRRGQLQIVVACSGAVEWHTTRPLPAT